MTTIVDLYKVQFANLGYVNQDGCHVGHLPAGPTHHGSRLDREALASKDPNYPGETMYQRAVRRGFVDTWTPVLRLQLAANHKLTYTGDRALSLWKAWNARVFGKKNL